MPFFEFWVRFSEPRRADLLSLVFFVDAFPPIVIETGHLSSAVSLSVYLRAKPAAGWLACRIRARHVADGMHDQELDIWDSSGKLVAQGRQLAAIVA